jgi:hypothetical protein
MLSSRRAPHPAPPRRSRGVAHVAKHGAWGRDIYADYLARVRELASGTWVVQTFTDARNRAAMASPRISEVVGMQFPDGSAYKSGSDHSKWAASLEVEGLVFIGDLNRTTGQLARGGGGLVIRSAALWRFLRANATSVTSAEH